MKLHQFKALSDDLQYKYLLVNGICIASREIEHNCILLFQLGSFYIELYFNQNCEQIISSRAFEDTDELSPYLEQLEIPVAF